MTTRLEVYNSALIICGDRTLSSLTEDREPRRLLDIVWDNEGVEACLERAQWKFAMRTVKLDFDTDVTTPFGFRRAFSKPSDWVLTSALCSDEYFTAPLTRYVDEAGYWYADIDEIFVRYVSSSDQYGTDLSLWPGTFSDYVSAHFASKIIFKLTQDVEKRERVLDWEKRQLKSAKSNDAMAGPQQFPAPGNWVNSRYRFGSRRDRGNRGQLIG
jgi:hypothetical protein